MKTKDIINKVEQFVQPAIEENDFELVDVEFLKEGASYYLRVYIDKEGGVAIDDCTLISRYLEKKLEDSEIIEKAYILEVSSPGIDRILKKEYEYEKYKGRLVDIKLYSPIDKKKEFRGELVGLLDNNIVIKSNDENIKFDKKDVAVCRLAVVF